MKDWTRIIILSVFSIILICKPIPYEELSSYQYQKTVSGAQPTKSNNFIPPEYGRQYSSDPGSWAGSESSQGFCPKPSLRLGAAGVDNSGGNGSGGSFDDSNIPQKSEWETNPEYWNNYKYDPNSFKNTKKEEECELEQKVEEEFHVSNSIEDLVSTALKNQNVKNEYNNRIRKRLEEGVNPVNIGKKSVPVAKDIVLIKGEHGRYLVKVSGGGKVKVLGMAARGNKKNINCFKTLMEKMYGVKLKY